MLVYIHFNRLQFWQKSLLEKKIEAWLGTCGLQNLTNTGAKRVLPCMSEVIMTNCIICPSPGILLKVTGVQSMTSCQVILRIIKNVGRVLTRCLIMALVSVLVASCGANNLHNLNVTLHSEYFLKRPPPIPLPLF